MRLEYGRMKIRFLILTLLSVLLASCTSEISPEGEGTGYLHVSVGKNTDIDEILVKSIGTGDEVIALDIYRNGETEPSVSVSDWTEFGTRELTTGHYRAVAYSGDNHSAAFDSPFYCGETDFVIARGKVANIDIECRLANVIVSTTFTQEIADNFQTYELTVSNGEGSLVFSKDAEGGSTLDKKGYFSATGSLVWSLRLVNFSGEVYESSEYEALGGTEADVKASQHYKFNFSVMPEEELGGGAFTIVLDDGLNVREIPLVLDFTQKDKPKFVNEDEFRGILEFYAGDANGKILEVMSPKEISSLKITHGSESMLSAGLPYETELTGASEEFISALNGAGLNVSAVTPEVLESSLDFTSFFASLPAGTYAFSVFIENVTGSNLKRDFEMTILPRVETDSYVNAWARFASVSGRWVTDEKPEGLTFRYRASGALEWIEMPAETVVIDEASRTFTAEITGLASGTSYEVCASCTLQPLASDVRFTTEQEQTLPNMSFDSWYQNGEVWYPNASLSESDYFWDTANGGSKALSVYPTVPEDNLVVSGRAAKLESKSVALVGLAAGNIYTGKFVKAITNPFDPGAQLNWGVPFTARPVALKGYYHYLPKTVDQGNHNGMSGKTDIAQIQIMLTDWSGPFLIDTQTGTFVDVNGSDILAYGTIDLNETSGYQEVLIKIDWRNITKKPTYIVIVASASKYGDYFTGGVGSTLYLDEFELVYDPADLSAR